MIDSRNIKELNTKVQQLCNAFIEACAAQHIEVIITSTYRDIEQQNALYAKGRTTPGQKVTNAKGGQSWHNWRCAFDFCPIVHGKAMWKDIDTFKLCGKIGKSLGLEYAGDWKTFKEYDHLQYTGGLTLADLQSGKQMG